MPVGLTLAPLPSATPVHDHVARARAAAEAGVGAVWLPQFDRLDALSLAAVVGHALGTTPGVTVGTAVVPVYPRHHLVVAAQARTAQAASGGRFVLGLGLSSPALVEDTYGFRPERPVDHLRRYVPALREAFAGGDDAAPPVFTAAVGPASLRAAGAVADGVVPYLVRPEVVAGEVVPTVTAAAEEAGRPRPRVLVVLPAVVTDDVAAARARAEEEMAFYGELPVWRRAMDRQGVGHAADLAAIGDEDAVAAAVRAYRDAGATDVTLAYSHVGSPGDEARTARLAGALNGAEQPPAPARPGNPPRDGD